jgi:hypothetical protein
MWCLHISNALIREQQMHSSSKFSLNSMEDILGAISVTSQELLLPQTIWKIGII